MSGNEFFEDVKDCVYVGYDLSGNFKIGMTNDWRRRAKQIQRMNPNFEILFLIPCDKPAVLEATLHHKFRNKRNLGEWFLLSAQDIHEIVTTYTDKKPSLEDVYNVWVGIAEGRQ